MKYVCDYCNYNPNCKSDLNKHLKSKKHFDNLKKVQLDITSPVDTQQNNGIIKENIETIPTKLLNGNIKESTKNKDKHNINTDNYIVDTDKKEIPKNNKKNEYKCPTCDAIFKFSSGLSKHKKNKCQFKSTCEKYKKEITDLKNI